MCKIKTVEFNKKMHMIRYKHVRNKDKDGVIEAKGGYTEAFIKEGDTVLETARAECSKKDVFRKELGRMISSGRLIKKLR